MEIITKPAKMTAWANEQAGAGKKIVLVPTMGFFHEGHLALMKKAQERADRVVVSLFVNPIQFGPNEDLDSYPRDFARDCELAQSVGVDVLFAPDVEAMYPDGAKTRVTVAGLTSGLCGAKRPGHFDGVTTVVAKLFNIVKPQVAVFGKKDFQQLAVIRKMVRDLNWDLEIVGQPIVREADGLAMSSRNKYLSPSQRKQALCLSAAIQLARKRVRQGMDDAEALVDELGDLICREKESEIDYISVVDKDSLAPVTKLQAGSVLALAVKIGKTRLIDNDNLFEENKE